MTARERVALAEIDVKRQMLLLDLQELMLGAALRNLELARHLLAIEEEGAPTWGAKIAPSMTSIKEVLAERERMAG